MYKNFNYLFYDSLLIKHKILYPYNHCEMFRFFIIISLNNTSEKNPYDPEWKLLHKKVKEINLLDFFFFFFLKKKKKKIN